MKSISIFFTILIISLFIGLYSFYYCKSSEVEITIIVKDVEGRDRQKTVSAYLDNGDLEQFIVDDQDLYYSLKEDKYIVKTQGFKGLYGLAKRHIIEAQIK